MNLKKAWEEGRVICGEWSRVEDGRQLLCLFTALAGDPEARPATCSADVCPRWLAHLLPWMADEVSDGEFPRVVERLVTLEPHLASLPSETEWRVRALCVREAMMHTQDAAALEVCERVATLCERRGRGENVSDEEFVEAARAAWAADATLQAWYVAAAAWAARAAAHAAVAGPGAWVWASAAAAESAAAAAAAEAVMSEASAADRITDAILTELERTVAMHGVSAPQLLPQSKG